MYYDYSYDSAGQILGGLIGGMLIFFVIFFIIALAVGIVQLIAQWFLYKKAGKGGWEAIVPFYCNWVLVEIAGLKWYWFLAFFAPMVCNFIGLGFIGWLAYLFGVFNIFYNISKRFNKGVGFAICSTLFAPICIAILGFSKKEVYDKNIPVSENGVFGTPVSTNSTNNVKPEQTSQVVPNVPEQKRPSFCTNCGAPVDPNAKFCTHCGTQI